MGTRNLTAVYSDGAYRVAQYGQWDGYPDGQGTTALEFCTKHLSTEAGRERFKRQLDLVKFCSDEEIKGFYAKLGITIGSGYVNCDDGDRFDRAYPHFSRNHGAKILDIVMHAEGPVYTRDALEFAGDSLFCEWAYVIDLDKRTFEVFKGFNEDADKVADRFRHLPQKVAGSGDTYYPVAHVVTFSLDALPTDAEFISVASRPKEDAAE